MIMVSISTFDWSSFKSLRSHPWQSSVVMLATVIVVVTTRDLSKGVFVGVLLSGVFFASSNSLVDAIDYQDVPPAVTIDVSGAHFWDVTAIGALDDIVHKLRRHGARVDVAGLNEASASMVDRFAKHHLPEAARKGGA
jgi:SulP family sulfate permease